MSKLVAGVTVFQDLVGPRMSINYSEVDDQGTVVADNKRLDRIITDTELKNIASRLMEGAQNILNAME